jgi:putative ABC transport system permease protein
MHIIGVVENFHFESLREHITPLILSYSNESDGMALRLTPDADLIKTLRGVESQFKSFLPSQSFTYSFADAEFEKTYRAEQRIGSILGGFAGFAILIACLGLFGLAVYMTEQRTKEIGIRKVLGATIGGITALLAKDFLKLVGIALLLAIPIAWFAMYKWLEDFAYRTPISWWLFGIAGLLAMGIALITVSYQSIKAAMANPVTSLRSE